MYGVKKYIFIYLCQRELEKNAKDVINFGEIVYWSAGKAIAIGFGKTPISVESEIRLADKCNVWGTTSFDLKKLKDIELGCEVLVEKYENNLMKNAISLALKSLKLNEVPVGCVIADAEEKLLAMVIIHQ